MNKVLKNLGCLVISLAVASSFGYGYYGWKTYVVPMSHNDFRQAMTSELADRAEVLLNGSAQDYEDGKLAEAIKVLELAQEQLVDKSGHYRAADKWKLERVYFLLGKAYQKKKAFGKAAENYIETLRLNPDNMEAKYNLEMIQPPPGGGGGGGDKPQPGKIQPKI